MKPAHPYGGVLEPLFDVVPISVVEVTDQLVTSKGSQVPISIHAKLGVLDVVFLDTSMKERRRGSVPLQLYTSTASSNFVSVYHQRIIVESMFCALRKQFSSVIRARTWFVQFREVALKSAVRNIDQALKF